MAIPAGGRVVVRSEEEAREGREGGEAGTFLSRARSRGELDDDAKRTRRRQACCFLCHVGPGMHLYYTTKL